MTSLDFDMPIALAGCVDQTAGADLRGIPWYTSALSISWPVDAMEREAARSLQRAGTGMMEMREAMAMSLVVALPDQRQARRSARPELVRQVELGATASEARRRCPVPMHRTTVYRLLKRVGQEGEQAFSERRHGHPVKLRGEVLTWLLDYCQSHASVSSSELQHLIAERFNLSVSVSQLNRARAAHGVRRVPPLRVKQAKAGLTIARGYHEQAGSLLLLVAAAETGLLTQLEQALPPAPDPHCLPLAGSSAVRQRLMLTLLFLGAVGLHRTWDLRGYTADGLALLTGRTRA